MAFALLALASPAVAQGGGGYRYICIPSCTPETPAQQAEREARNAAKEQREAEQAALDVQYRAEVEKRAAEQAARWQLSQQRSAEAERLAEMEVKAMRAKLADCRVNGGNAEVACAVEF